MAAVGCAGILVADTFCGPMRSLPEPGELFALDAMPSKAGGCAANTAICLGKQGVDVDVVGCLGRDAPADTVRADLERSGVGTAGITYVDGHQTSQTVILLVEGEDRRFIHMFGANRAFTVDHVDRDLHRGVSRALASARLEEVEPSLLYGELEILHFAIVGL